jgi:tRNA(Arg) A34 adenosine deaminase TadA
MSDPVSRRWLCKAAIIASAVTATDRGASANTSATSQTDIIQPGSATKKAFIERAFEMRRMAVEKGDQAYGAVIVRDGIIVGQSWSRVVLDQDPTGHAEMAAIRDAARRLNDRDLTGAIMYSSSRPCPMCEAAAYWADISSMIYGHDADMAGAPKLCS